MGRILMLTQLINGKRDAADFSLAGERFADEALEPAGDHTTAAQIGDLTGDGQAIARMDNATKPNIVEPTKTHHFATEKIVAVRVVGANLGRHFTHNNARHQRDARHVTRVPKLTLGRQIAIADADVGFWIVEDDRRELFHRVALRIMATDRFEVGNDVAVVDVDKIDNQIFATHIKNPQANLEIALGLHLLPTILTGTTVRRAFAVVGFFDFATRFGHDGLLLVSNGGCWNPRF